MPSPRRRIQRLTITTLTVFALCIQLAFPAVSLAAATTDCSEGPGAVNHWRGEALTGGAKHGTSGTVEGRTLQMCTSPNVPLEVDGTFYFSNIEATSPSFRDLIQIGFGQGRSPTIPAGMRYYSGWGRSTSTAGCSGYSNRDPFATDEGAYVKASHDYKVYHQTSNWRLFVDSSEKLTVAEDSICWSPGRATWFAETWDSGDRIGGTEADHVSVTSMNYATAAGGGFFYTNFNASDPCNYSVDPPTAYKCDITSAKSIDLWTIPR